MLLPVVRNVAGVVAAVVIVVDVVVLVGAIMEYGLLLFVVDGAGDAIAGAGD